MAKEKVNIKRIFFPKNAEREDYFFAAVLYIISETKPLIVECVDKNNSDVNNPKLMSLVKAAVPGINSTLFRIEIINNINQHIIDDKNLDLNQKIAKIAKSIERYVDCTV